MLKLDHFGSRLSAGFCLALLLSSCSWIIAAPTNPSATSKYIVAEDNGIFQISSDGNAWLKIKPAESETWNGLSISNDRVIAVGMSGAISDSNDGVNWSPVVIKDHRVWLYDMIYAKPQYIAVGMGGMVVSSENLKLWQRKTVPTKSWLNSISYGNQVLVASGASGTIISSKNGGNIWSSESTSTTEWLSQVRFLNQQFIAVGSSGAILSSADGHTWQAHNSATKKWLYTVSYGNERYLAAGADSNVVSSKDGVNWRLLRTNLPKKATIRSMIFANQQFWVVGSNGLVASSSDGVIWQLHSINTSHGLNSIIYFDTP